MIVGCGSLVVAVWMTGYDSGAAPSSVYQMGQSHQLVLPICEPGGK